MKLLAIIFIILLAGCTPYTPPVAHYTTSVEVSFANELKSDFKIQYQQNNTWQTIKSYNNLPMGTHIDTINFAVGLYRLWCPLDSSQIFFIK